MTHLNQVKEDDILIADGGFTCIPEGRHVVKRDRWGLYIRCKEGRHYLHGQTGYRGELVGLTRAEVS